jgi:hypothetical protein
MMKSYLNSEKMNRFLNFTVLASGKLRVAMVLFVFLFASNIEATAQITQRGVATTNTSTNTSVTIDKPEGLVEGDIMFANIVQSDDDNDALRNATLTGWTLVAGEEFGNDGDDSWWGTILYKVATVTDVAAIDFTFTGDNDADDMVGGIVAFSGVAVTGGVSGGPFDVTPGTINNINKDDFSATAITTVTNNAAVIMFGMIGDNRSISSWAASSPSTLTELFDVPFNANADMGVGVAWGTKTTAGSTGTGLGELYGNENDFNGALLIALRPACPANTAGTASSTPTLCVNTALTDITITTTGATGIGTATDLPAGVTAAWASNTITISGTPTASGTFNYTIPLTGGCGSVDATGTITVTAAATAGTLSGTQTLCSSGTTTLSSTISGGTWSSGTTGIATINTTTGVVTGVSAGTATMTYTVAGTGGCGNATATRTVTVTAAATAGTLSGTQTLCSNGTTTLSSTISGGTWSSGTTGIATINTTTGVVTGVSAGTATMTYTVAGTGGCGNATATRTVTVSPASVGGTATANVSAVCIGSGTSIALAGYTGTIQWQQSANGTSGWADVTTGSGGTSATYNTPNLATTTYYRASVTSGGCALANSTVVEVTVKPLPTATITANYCAVAGKIQLTASGGDTYLWNTGQTSNPILVDLAGNYSVIASLGGCTSTPFFLNVGQELVTNGDFTAGNTGFTSGYTYKEDIADNNMELYDDTGNNGYALGTNGQNYHTNFWGIDHTNNPNGSKNFMLVNGHGSTITIWQQTVNVQPNTDYYFSAWAMSLNNGGPYARLRFEVNGVQVGTTANLGTGPSNATEALANNYWTRFYSNPIWNSGSLNGPITIKIVNLESSASGNDFALDDISFGTLAALPFSIVATGNTGTDSTLCTGETFNLFANLTNVKDPITYSWTGPNGFTSTLANPSILNVTTSNSGNYTLTVTDGYNCGSQTKSVNLTVTPLLISPTIGITTQPTCTKATGSVVLNGLPASGTWNLYQNGNETPIVTGGSGTSTTISDLVVGDYTFTVSIGACISSSSYSVSINPLVTNTWNGTSWSPNIPTDALHIDQNIVFEGDYNANKNLYGCSCEVKSGAVVIHETYTMKVTNDVKVTGGSLTFLNTASLVQTNDVANTGNITYNRSTPTVRPTDYVYWSSPVSGQTIANFSPTVGSIKYYYDLGWKAPSDSDVMAKGLGYIIRGQVTSNNKYDASFVGVPNNGPVAMPANTPAKYYLVGNPYPSAIDAVAFLDQNAGLDGNIYLWTHNTEIAKNASGTELVYTSDDYATYNSIVGGVATNQANKPIGKIAAGQSFFVKTIAATTIQFNNDMRVGSKSDDKEQNSQFFRTTNTNTTKSKTAVVEKHRLWLNLTNDQGAFKQTLLAYVTGATNDLDTRFDGENFNGNAYVNFYSINQNKNFTIQGRALPFNESDEVALGFKSIMKGSFTIAIDEVDGLLANQDVFIEDKLKGTTFNLKTGNYTFDTEIGTFNERFVIRYTDKTLATEDFTIAQNTVLVSVKNKQVKINAGETIDNVVVYDLLGRQIYTKTAVNSNELVFSNIVSAQQTLLVKVVLQNGSSSTKKIVY